MYFFGIRNFTNLFLDFQFHRSWTERLVFVWRCSRIQSEKSWASRPAAGSLPWVNLFCLIFHYLPLVLGLFLVLEISWIVSIRDANFNVDIVNKSLSLTFSHHSFLYLWRNLIIIEYEKLIKKSSINALYYSI